MVKSPYGQARIAVIKVSISDPEKTHRCYRGVALTGGALRFVFVHNHIFKNAGSTVDSIFERAGFRPLAIEATAERPIVEAEQVLGVVQADPSIEYVSSHSFAVPRPPDVPGIGFVDITFLRHPMDRLASIYHYTRHPSVADFPFIEKSASFQAFVDALIEQAPHHIHSPQTTCLGNYRNFYYPPGEVALERAKAWVLDTRVLGVVDLFDASMQAFIGSCAALMPGKNVDVFRGPFAPMNRSRGDQLDLDARLQRIAAELGPERVKFLEAANAADLDLYSTARREVLRRHGLVAGGSRAKPAPIP